MKGRQDSRRNRYRNSSSYGRTGDLHAKKKSTGSGMSIDKQLEELGELQYNGAKAKNFQLYKKLKDMQLREKYGQYGEFISTGEFPIAPK